MDINELSLKERLLLCRRAEQACVRHFGMLAERLEPEDKLLSQHFQRLVAEEEQHGVAIDRFDDGVPWPGVWFLDEPAITRILRQHFPILFTGWRHGFVDRRSALEFAEAVEEESSQFYRMLSDLASHPASQTFFRKIARKEEAHRVELHENNIRGGEPL